MPDVISLAQRRSRANQHDVLHRIIRDHEPALRRFLRTRLAAHTDYEDLVQEIYLKLAKQDNLDEKLMKGEAETRSYLFAIATNLIRDQYRRDRVGREVGRILAAEGLMENHAPSPEDILVSRQDLVAVKRAILALPPNCRRAFVLGRFMNLSYREIAEEMDISISMVEKHIMRALMALRACVVL